MAFFFRKKKKNNSAPPEQPSLEDDRKKIDTIQKELDRLKEQYGRSALQETNSSRPTCMSGRGDESHLVRGLPTPRNHSLTQFEAGRNALASIEASKSGTRQSIAEIIINNDPLTGKYDPTEVQRKCTHAERTSSIASKSIASSHGDGEVFYKDGKKYRRVVRIVKPAASNDLYPFVSTPSSFRSVSSAHGRDEVTDGHVQAMKARFSMNSVTSDVSMNSRVSSTSKTYGQKKTLRVRTVADSHPFLTPTQNDDRKTPMSQIEQSPAPFDLVSDNPWMRNKLKQRDSSIADGGVTRPATPAAISQWVQRQSDHLDVRGEAAKSHLTSSTHHKIQTDPFYGKASSISKKPPFPADIFTPSQVTEGPHQNSLPVNMNPSATTSTTRQKLFSPQETPSKRKKNEKPPLKAMEESLKLFSPQNPPPVMKASDTVHCAEDRPSKITTVEDKPAKKSQNATTKRNKAQEITTMTPTSWRLPFSKTEKKTPPPSSSGARTQPMNLLDQIKKQDVQLKKVPSAQERTSKTPARSMGNVSNAGAQVGETRSGPKKPVRSQADVPDPGALMAGIRAGVALKKVDKSTTPAPKKHVSPMTELLAKIQAKKAECLRKEQEADSDEIDW
jgi:hypothetical protein